MKYEKALPTYTTERYYILSELEQKANLVSFSDLDLNKSSTPSDGVGTKPNSLTPISDICACYLLWDLTNKTKKEFMTELQIFVAKLSGAEIDLHRTFLSVEVYVGNLSCWPSSPQKAVVDRCFHEIAELDRFAAFSLGISNTSAGTAALESILDWFTFASNAATLTECFGTIFTTSSSVVLGFDQERQPDAASDVLQILYSSEQQFELEHLSKTLAESSSIQKSRSVASPQHSPKTTETIMLYLVLFAIISVSILMLLFKNSQ